VKSADWDQEVVVLFEK